MVVPKIAPLQRTVTEHLQGARNAAKAEEEAAAAERAARVAAERERAKREKLPSLKAFKHDLEAKVIHAKEEQQQKAIKEAAAAAAAAASVGMSEEEAAEAERLRLAARTRRVRARRIARGEFGGPWANCGGIGPIGSSISSRGSRLGSKGGPKGGRFPNWRGPIRVDAEHIAHPPSA